MKSLEAAFGQRGLAFWMAAVYLALFIIRPWELLFPSLGMIRFERMYAIAMIVAVAASCGLRPFLGSKTTMAVFSFLAAICVSGLFALDPSLATEGIYTYVTLVVFYVVILSVVRTPYQLVFVVCMLRRHDGRLSCKSSVGVLREFRLPELRPR